MSGRCASLDVSFAPRRLREHDLVGSFALLVASAAFTIPFARMTEPDHPLGRPERELSRAVRTGEPMRAQSEPSGLEGSLFAALCTCGLPAITPPGGEGIHPQ
jgi:hypothetical protein